MKRFKRPTQDDIRRAIEIPSLQDVKGSSRVFIADFESSKCFDKIPIPKSSDWLACHKEMGQTLKSFKRFTMCARPHGSYKTIYVQPIGSFKSGNIVPLKVIREFVLAFFHTLDCKVLPVHSLKKANSISELTTRPLFSGSEITQLKTGSVLKYIETTKKKRTTPKQRERFRKEIVTIGITYPFDLYPDDEWNFVFGIARIMDGVGVYSLARFDPDFPDLELEEEEEENGYSQLVLRRSIKCIAHEVGHLFGLKHCIHYHCIMNGSNHQEESDSHPMFMCPVCLRKFYDNLKCDLKERYVALLKFFDKYKMKDESDWIKKRFEEVGEKISD